MRIYHNNAEIEVDTIEVDKYYRHISSDTYWKLHSMNMTPVGNSLDIELVNEYGEIKDVNVIIREDTLFVSEGAFEEITKKEFMERKGKR